MAIWLKSFTVGVIIFLWSSTNAQDLLNVPVAIPAVSPAATTFVVARDRGYFREEGLDVQLIVMPSAVGTQALIGGNVKFSTVGGAGLLPTLRGAPLRFLFTTFNRPMFWLYAKSDIRSVEALKGRKVGVSSLGSGPDSLLRDLLKKHGLEGGRDVVILPMGAGTARFHALQAGSIDAAVLSIPSNFIGQRGRLPRARFFHRPRMGRVAGQCVDKSAGHGVRTELGRKIYPCLTQRLSLLSRSTCGNRRDPRALHES